MAGETPLTIVGNLTGDPELRYTPQGAPVTTFTVASTPRTYDRATNEWRDGDTVFMRCQQWREPGENTAESLHKGDRVVVTGHLKATSWQDKETGAKRTALELTVDEVGASTRYATLKVTRTPRPGDAAGGTDARTAVRDTARRATTRATAAAGGDPWATPTPAGDPWRIADDEPPF